MPIMATCLSSGGPSAWKAKCHLEWRLCGYHEWDHRTCRCKGYYSDCLVCCQCSIWRCQKSLLSGLSYQICLQQANPQMDSMKTGLFNRTDILCLTQGQRFRTFLSSSSAHCGQGSHFLWRSSHGQWSAQAILQRCMHCIGTSFWWQWMAPVSGGGRSYGNRTSAQGSFHHHPLWMLSIKSKAFMGYPQPQTLRWSQVQTSAQAHLRGSIQWRCLGLWSLSNWPASVKLQQVTQRLARYAAGPAGVGRCCS